jgi:hypothetical protein
MLSCKEVSYLASKKLDQKLTLWERMGFFLHISMCRMCRGYSRELKAMQDKVQEMGGAEDIALSESVTLSEESRNRIKSALDKALHKTETS